ncbi:hypothetical protein J3458_004438 [Metarhizium acridum]|uniref:uncharacterized protein n=1 Tax=Metarhizium acridum TaxID=92637 RepID=UPI001C6AEE55|nr:hypothetical protein J3458_004438 [Metarhizium acridum]
MENWSLAKDPQGRPSHTPRRLRSNPNIAIHSQALVQGEDVENTKAENPIRFLGTCRYMNAALDFWHHEVTTRRGPLHNIVAQTRCQKHQTASLNNLSDGQKLLAFWAAKLIIFATATKALGLYAAAPEDQPPWLDVDYKNRALEIADSICILALAFSAHLTAPRNAVSNATAACYGCLGRPERQAWCFEQIQTTMDGNCGIWDKSWIFF